MDSYAYSHPYPHQDADETAHDVESLLWLAAGAAWAIVAIKVLNEARKIEARKRTVSVSSRLLQQVFPHGIRP